MKSDVREKILEATRCTSLKEGYKRTTVNSVARTAGISPSAICPYFNGGKDLFESLDTSEEEALQDAHNANRTSILQMVLTLFEEHGYDGVSMDMLARESSYSKATLHQYFKDKEGLYSAIMQETPFYFNFLSIQPEIDGCDLEAAIRKVGLAYLAVFDTPECIVFTRAIIRDSKRHLEVSGIYHKDGIGYVARCVETVLKRCTNNLQEGVDIYLAAKTYVGSLLRLAIQYKIIAGMEPQYGDGEIVDTLTKIFLHGILH